jgi:hypothetical protein
MCGTTSTTTRDYTINGHRVTFRFWECVHYDPVDGHGFSASAAKPEWKD